LTVYETRDGAPWTTSVEADPGDHYAWDGIADHFCACILDGVACEAPLRHGLAVLQILEALQESASTGREVLLDC
jgi:predicted dehydrogenase